MARPDSTAGAALESNKTVLPVYFIFMDFVDDVLRANTSGRDVTLSGTGQTNLDGEYFGITPTVVAISPVRMSSGGSQPVTATLSGLRDINDDLLEAINTKSRWQGRTARLWQMIRNESKAQQGGIRHYYTGYMVNVGVRGSRSAQTIEMTIESYLASFSAPSGRTYLDAADFDPDDLSAKAAIAIANGISGNSLTNNTNVGGNAFNGGGGGGGFNYGEALK